MSDRISKEPAARKRARAGNGRKGKSDVANPLARALGDMLEARGFTIVEEQRRKPGFGGHPTLSIKLIDRVRECALNPMTRSRRFDGGRVLGGPIAPVVLAQAEAALGFTLPAPIYQIYAIADGGFGPGDEGFWPLVRVVTEYRALASQPGSEKWPPEFLPLYRRDRTTFCFDLVNGAMRAVDADREGFTTECKSLVSLLEDWLISPIYLRQSA
jgi:hypothetical protein